MSEARKWWGVVNFHAGAKPPTVVSLWRTREEAAAIAGGHPVVYLTIEGPENPLEKTANRLIRYLETAVELGNLEAARDEADSGRVD